MKYNRCPWPGNDELMIHYHDEEWGVPLHDDKKLFEFKINVMNKFKIIDSFNKLLIDLDYILEKLSEEEI